MLHVKLRAYYVQGQAFEVCWQLFLGGMVVSIDNNQMYFTAEDTPTLPEPEGSQLWVALLQ